MDGGCLRSLIIRAATGMDVLLSILAIVFVYRINQYDDLGYPIVDCVPWQECPESCTETPPEEELVRSAVSALIDQQPDRVSVPLSSGERDWATVLKYSSVEEFLENNPDCCEFRLGAPRDDPWPYALNSQRTQDYFGHVRIKHVFSAVLEDGRQYTSSTDREISMNSCGAAIDWR